MAFFLTSNISLLSPQNPNFIPRLSSNQSPILYIPFSSSSKILKSPRFPSLRINSSFSTGENEPNPSETESSTSKIVDEWGEKSEPEPVSSYTKFSESDPPKDEDEWGGEDDVSVPVNGIPEAVVDDTVGDLKRCLVDTFYGTELGFKASSEVRAEVLELVNQLEALNPTPAPTEASSLLDGKWVLLYTAFSELLPLLAAGTLPLVKVESISQSINTTNLTIDNSTTLSSPFATLSFSALATFEVRSPSRIQVTFKEGSFQPPEISSTISLPQNIDIFGQNIDLSPVQRTLNPLQDVVANISRAISGQPSLKVPIPGDRSSSWLLTTYLDEDLRISRGDGGLFILAKEGSPLLDQ